MAALNSSIILSAFYPKTIERLLDQKGSWNVFRLFCNTELPNVLTEFKEKYAADAFAFHVAIISVLQFPAIRIAVKCRHGSFDVRVLLDARSFVFQIEGKTKNGKAEKAMEAAKIIYVDIDATVAALAAAAAAAAAEKED
ncbi:MAG: hypothetical protein MO853_12910 [Candidatus Protistobacter heckmanni]|nr:hypothetical protein [Candidatus Protistobacter heckmanni]